MYGKGKEKHLMGPWTLTNYGLALEVEQVHCGGAKQSVPTNNLATHIEDLMSKKIPFTLQS